MTHTSKQFSSPHFEVQELAEGVFAVLGEREGLCHSNAAIVDLGDRTLVLDTLTLPSYGDDLARASRELTGRDPSWIAFTHYHADHLLGNQSFPSTTPLIATQGMLAPTEEWMGQYQGAIDDPDGFKQEVVDFAATCEAEEDPLKRAAMETNLARYQALYDDIDVLRLVRPNTVFEGKMVLSGSKRTVELIEIPNAHTVSDVYLRLPEEGILFMGDLGFFDTIPFLGFADPLRWIDILRDFEASDMKTFIPGHGIVGGTGKVKVQRECIEAIVAAAREVLAAGEEVTGVLGERLPEPFRTWEGQGGRFNLMNYMAVAKSLSSEKQD
jgi:cyclase